MANKELTLSLAIEASVNTGTSICNSEFSASTPWLEELHVFSEEGIFSFAL